MERPSNARAARQTIAFISIAITMLWAPGKAFGQIGDFEGKFADVDVAVTVLDALSRQPIPDARVTLPMAEGITDLSGTAILHAKFSARGGDFGVSWKIGGFLRIEKVGYLLADTPLVNYTGQTVYGLEYNRIEVVAYLYPGYYRGEILPLPIRFDPSTSLYLLEGVWYRPDWWAAGYSSFADVVASHVPDDQRLRQYADAYKRKVDDAKNLFWSGLIILGVGDLAGLAIMLAEPTDASVAARISAVICVGIGTGGAVASLVAVLSPGGPKELVDYYNETYAER